MDSSSLKAYFSQYEELDYVIVYGSIGRGESPCVRFRWKGLYIQ